MTFTASGPSSFTACRETSRAPAKRRCSSYPTKHQPTRWYPLSRSPHSARMPRSRCSHGASRPNLGPDDWPCAQVSLDAPTIEASVPEAHELTCAAGGVNRGPQSTGLPVEISVAAVGQILRQMLVLIAVPQRHAPEWQAGIHRRATCAKMVRGIRLEGRVMAKKEAVEATGLGKRPAGGVPSLGHEAGY